MFKLLGLGLSVIYLLMKLKPFAFFPFLFSTISADLDGAPFG